MIVGYEGSQRTPEKQQQQKKITTLKAEIIFTQKAEKPKHNILLQQCETHVN